MIILPFLRHWDIRFGPPSKVPLRDMPPIVNIIWENLILGCGSRDQGTGTSGQGAVVCRLVARIHRYLREALCFALSSKKFAIWHLTIPCVSKPQPSEGCQPSRIRASSTQGGFVDTHPPNHGRHAAQFRVSTLSLFLYDMIYQRNTAYHMLSPSLLAVGNVGRDAPALR